MSVAFSFRVDYRPYSGYRDPSLPIGAWTSQAGAVGNASGGIITLDFLFQRDGDPLVTELFNLEQLAVDTSSEAVREFIMTTISMDNLSPSRLASPQIWHFQTNGAPGLGQSAVSLETGTMLPLWFGPPNREEGDSGIRLQTQNVDLVFYAITFQGYIWGPRSILAEGGPRRPVGGLFGKG